MMSDDEKAAFLKQCEEEFKNRYTDQGSILQNSILAENFPDKFSSSNFRTMFHPNTCYLSIVDNNLSFLICFIPTAMRLRSWRPLHAIGDAGHHG
jgi:hypothetical protein